MHRFHLLLLLLLVLVLKPPGLAAEPAVTLPWEEFRGLYTEDVRRRIEAARPAQAKPARVALERADLRLRVGAGGAHGELAIEGQRLAGKPEPQPDPESGHEPQPEAEPEPIRLLSAGLAVTGVGQAEGAVLARCAGDYCLHLTGADHFKIDLHLALPLERGEHERLLRLDLPPAVTRSLVLEIEDGLELLEPPGLPREDGRYYLTGQEGLTLRLKERTGDPADQAPVVDSFTRIEAQGEGLVATSWFLPLRIPAAELAIALSPSARLLGSDLPAGSLREVGEGRLSVGLDRDRAAPFALRYQLPLQPGQRGEAVRLPSIPDNLGREGGFLLVQPEDGRIALEADGLQGPSSPERLTSALREAAALEEPFFRTGGDLRLTLERYLAVDSPDLVLETLHLYTSYAENGRALTVLRLTLPPEAGDRLALQAMSEAEIWYLKVNGRRRRLYAENGDTWVVPLERGRDSEVELAYLRQGTRLGLEGRVALDMPPIGITARQLHVGIRLAERVQLVALEGDLVPAPTDGWPKIEGFDGRLHHFVLPFYQGDGVTAAIYYREPVVTGEEG